MSGDIVTINSVKYSTIECRYFPKPTQIEPAEIELIYINKGEGVCFAGDGLTSFHTGELFLFSGQLSHYLKSASQFYAPNYPLRCGATQIQFSQQVLPAQLTTLKECANINHLLEVAQQGIKWSARVVDRSIVERIEQMDMLNSFDRMLQLYDILNKLGQMTDKSQEIASAALINSRHSTNNGYRRTIDYIIHNFDQPITLEELAKHIGINKTALCRQFKGHAGRSIFDFLLGLRVNYAKEQLLRTKRPIAEIAFGAGFNNLPNFNVQFKRIAGCTPGEYRLQLIQKSIK